MRHTLLLLVAASLAAAQAPDEDFHVYRDGPRLLLTTQRLRLLERERERSSVRWQNFDQLMQSGAPLPEPGLAWALHYRVTHQNPSGRKAIEWALTGEDLRQLAVVYDWCLPLLSAPEKDRLEAKLKAGLAKPGTDIQQQDARALAAVGTTGRLPLFMCCSLPVDAVEKFIDLRLDGTTLLHVLAQGVCRGERRAVAPRLGHD